MSALFCDASAIVKRYASETGSAWVIQATEPASGNTVYLARITRVEVISAITRRMAEGTLSAAEGATGIADLNDDFVRHYRVVEVTPHHIEVTLISADLALNDAAIAEGFAVDDPNAHP